MMVGGVHAPADYELVGRHDPVTCVQNRSAIRILFLVHRATGRCILTRICLCSYSAHTRSDFPALPTFRV